VYSVKLPRYRRKRQLYQSSLKRGFYARDNSPVIHYVDYYRNIRGVDAIDEGQLKKVALPAVFNLGPEPILSLRAYDNAAHVQLHNTSFAFETEAVRALRLIKDENIDALGQEYGSTGERAQWVDPKFQQIVALKLLLLGIQHDLDLLAKPGNRQPNYRLYDLAAVLALRNGVEASYLREIIRTIKGNDKISDKFALRIKKWEDTSPRNRWRLKWGPGKKEVTWGTITL
ncbi:MAG: hypothetical protein ICV83_09075, partial [Cytophagales bacterium]|nr:hypothetical protein [Cytophagales bacterium]